MNTKSRLRFALAIASAVAIASTTTAETEAVAQDGAPAAKKPAKSTAKAQIKGHRKAAEELLEFIGIEAQLASSIKQSLDVQIKANPAIEPFKDAMKTFLEKHMSYASLKEDLITIYANAFTEKELKEITAFYKTPIGKKLVEKTPELMGKGMELGVKRVQDNQAELMGMIRAEASKPKN